MPSAPRLRVLLPALLAACADAAPTTPAADAGAATLDAAADVPVDAPTADVDPAVARGARVFRLYCARCHGARGAGTGDGPDLRAGVPATTDDAIRGLLRDGGRTMPVVPIDDAQRADVFNYLRATFGAYQGP